MPRKGGSIGRIDRINKKLIKHATSERTGICEICGKPFEQVWRPSKGKDGVGEYTHFKTCGACRMAKASGYRKVVIPYTPHPAQQKIHDSKARSADFSRKPFRKDFAHCSVMKFLDGERNRSIDINPPVLY